LQTLGLGTWTNRRRRYQSEGITADGLTTHECRLNNLSQLGAELVVEAATVVASAVLKAILGTLKGLPCDESLGATFWHAMCKMG